MSKENFELWAKSLEEDGIELWCLERGNDYEGLYETVRKDIVNHRETRQVTYHVITGDGWYASVDYLSALTKWKNYSKT